MTHRYKKQIIAFIFFLLFIATWSILVYQFPPQELVNRLGVTNGYAIAFIAAFLGGVSTFTSVPYAIIVITLGAGGLDPYLLGAVSAVGLFFGDITSYFLGFYGHQVVPTRLQVQLQKVHRWLLNRKYPWTVPMVIFFYGAFFPMSNDFVVISFGLARYPFWRVMIPLGLGSIVFNTLLAFVGQYGITLF
jgi:membrane protein YqaA with SNARE-associated domain